MSQLEPMLVRPSHQYKESFLEAITEYVAENLEIRWNPDTSEKSFEEFLQAIAREEKTPSGQRVPETFYWLVLGDEYIGELGLRHTLNDSLKRFGGHIGYKIRPSQRCKGYGTRICQLGIIEARKLGITEILITCDDNNIGSQKIIEANGGILKDKVDNNRAVLSRRYWIY